jgi:ABC-type sugar transport system ATPase subunit
MIELRAVTIEADKFSLNRFSMLVPSGSYGVLMGPTGSGKTTLLEAICGLRKVREGEIRIGNADVTRWQPGDRQIGYVPQDVALFPTLSVREHLAFALRLRKTPSSEITRRVCELAELLSLGDLLDRRVQRLSGGEAQRVAIGRALSFGPSVLLLDEPLSALDESSRTQMQTLLRTVHDTTKMTTLHVTHSSDEAAALADCRFQMPLKADDRQPNDE